MENESSIRKILELLRQQGNSGLGLDQEDIETKLANDEHEKIGLSTKILSIIGGILSSLAFVGFLALTALIHSEWSMLIFGFLFIAGSVFLNKIHNKLIIESICISFYVIGFILIGIGWYGISSLEPDIMYLLFAVIALAVIFITDSYMLVFLSALMINGSLLFFMDGEVLSTLFVSAQTLLMTYWYLSEAKIMGTSKKFAALYNPVRTGLTLSFLATWIFFYAKHMVFGGFSFSWLSSITFIGVLFFIIHKITTVLNIESVKTKSMIYAVSGLIILLAIFAPAILGSLLVVLLCFYVSYKTGFILAIVSLIYSISEFYYYLDISLLAKSGILFFSGLLFLLFFAVAHKKAQADEKL